MICFHTVECADVQWILLCDSVFPFLLKYFVTPLVKNPRTGYISPAKALVMLTISKGLFSFFSHNHTLTFDQSKVGEIRADLWPHCYPFWSHIDLSTQTAQNCLALSYSLMLRISSAGLHPCSLCSRFC